MWFGHREDAIYHTSVFFKNSYREGWITDDFARRAISDVDKSEVIGGHLIHSPVPGDIPPERLSGGDKAFILMKQYPRKIFNASSCGDNCAKWILELAQDCDFTINLYHIMDFGKKPFEIRIMNARNGKNGLPAACRNFRMPASAIFMRMRTRCGRARNEGRISRRGAEQPQSL